MRWTLARAIVRLAAYLAPSSRRARWREEWLAEIEGQRAEGKGQREGGREKGRRDFKTLRAALGAPWDAIAIRRVSRPARRGGAAFGLGTDVRQSLRLIARSPGHVIMVVVSLSIGLTATIVALAVLAAFLRGEPAGVRDRQTLARVEVLFSLEGGYRRPRGDFSLNDVAVLHSSLPQPRAHVDSVAATGAMKVTIRIGDAVDSVMGRFVDGNYFDVLGTRPAAGRLLTPADDRLDADVAVISYDYWQKHFQGRHDAVGKSLVAGNRVLRIVGVTPAGFNPYRSGPLVQRSDPVNTPRVVFPLSLARAWPGAPAASDSWLALVARLTLGNSRKAGQEELRTAARALEAANPTIGRDLELILNDFVLPRGAVEPGEIATAFAVLLGGPLMLLAIGCANVANMRLSRATRRTHEFAVRRALGAGRARLVRLLLIEAGFVTLVSLAVSWTAARAIVHYYSETLLVVTVPFDNGVLSGAALVAAIVVVLSGLAPAWLVTRRSALHTLKQTAQAGGIAHSRLRAALVVVQVALSIVVLAIGSLFARSLQTVNGARPEVIDQLLVARIDLASQGYDSSAAAQFASTLLERLQQDARFGAVGIGTAELFGGSSQTVRLRLAGATDEIKRGVVTSQVTPGWFGSMNLRPLSGRLFAANERTDVAVVNETTARLLTEAGSPVGLTVSVQRFRQIVGALHTRSEVSVAEIVGVVPDSVRGPNRPLYAVPWMYFPLDPRTDFPTMFTLFGRTSQPVELAPDLSRLITETDRGAAWTRVEPAAAIFAAETSPTRSLAAGVGSSGLVALMLAAAGLFAVLAYSVSLRSREIGIRMALGAAPRRVTGLVLRQAFRLTLTGIVIGYALALPLAHAIRVVFLGVSPLDPVALVPVGLALLLTACIAAAVPARRAASVDPVTVLRSE
ncbi:MAG TPA: ABC transporter permease [Vicinamibacterales bacterium]|nr:ABC transporter permease [Vicinamibacterales bacterium]